jgi:AcrR family transcriptional regulator
MRDTRQEILETAKRLFNEKGFNVVSTRDIAEAMGISKGNLTYHFKKKADIVEALLLESPDTRPKEAPDTLAELDAYFLDMQQTVKENAFYFWHHTQIAQLSPKIRERQDESHKTNVKMLSQTLQTLRSKGLLHQETRAGNHERLIDLLLISIIYWVPFCELKNGYGTKVSFQHHAWSVLYPYLTGAGKNELKRTVSLA